MVNRDAGKAYSVFRVLVSGNVGGFGVSGRVCRLSNSGVLQYRTHYMGTPTMKAMNEVLSPKRLSKVDPQVEGAEC